MDEEDEINTTEKDLSENNPSYCSGRLYLVGIGPGPVVKQTKEALDIIASSEVVLGYQLYLDLVRELIKDKEIYSSGMGGEEERCRMAISLAKKGKKVVLLSSGDTGVYGMAGLVLEIMANKGLEITLEIIPGVPSANTAAARLGAPLMLDYATISLSDLLVPWEVIEKRLVAAASSDMVIVLYNPKSKDRQWQLSKAQDIILQYRSAETPVGIVTDAGRDNEQVVITTLTRLGEEYITMRSIVIIGNSTTFRYQDWLITPRGYQLI